MPSRRAAIDAEGDPRQRADGGDATATAELTGMITSLAGARCSRGLPDGTRIIASRERPHPGAQLDPIEERDGWRYMRFATDTGQLQPLDARHRAHARVEDRIRCRKDTGLGRFPSKVFTINTARMVCALIAMDLIAWTQPTLLHDHPALARAEPKPLCYRLLHVAARLVRGQRRLRLKID